MLDFPLRQRVFLTGVIAAVVLTGCTTPPPPPAPKPVTPTCKAAAADDALLGNWLSVRKQKGVAGELRTLFTLHPDGTMAYTEQLKRGKHPSQGLAEAGCWQRDNQTLTLQTLKSNGEPVDTADPIYTNRYTIVDSGRQSFTLRDADGALIKAKRMSPGYRLPF
jgi:hypothetical protein